MYISKIKIIAEKHNVISKKLANTLDELGYFILNEKEYDADVFVYFNSVEETVKDILSHKNLANKVVISVAEDGSYVIPLLNEKNGGSIIGEIIADILNSELILTTKTSQIGLYSIEEFSWINAVKILNPEKIPLYEQKMIKEGRLKVFSEDLGIAPIEGYEITDEINKADIVITFSEEYLSSEHNGKLLAKPLQLAVALEYNDNVPRDALYFAIISTLKSINIKRRKLDFLLVSKRKENDERIKEISKLFNAMIIYVSERRGGEICKPLINFLRSNVILKKTKRGYGIYTCLGLERERKIHHV